jgi:hypothetical protein
MHYTLLIAQMLLMVSMHQSLNAECFLGINESVPGSGTTREQAQQGHKLPVLLPSLGCPVNADVEFSEPP